MSKYSTLLLLLLVSLLTQSCEDDDCTKTITHPGYTMYTPGGGVIYPERTQVIPCNDPGPAREELSQNVTYLEDFAAEVLDFNFTPDTGNNTSRLQFELKLYNHTNTRAQGVPILTLLVDGDESTSSFSSHASIPCYEIEANSFCILTYDRESSLDVRIIENIYLVEVKYILNR